MKKRCISFIRNFSIAVFCTFTAFSHCLFGYASNDDEYISFTDVELIKAYNYFKLYGLTADTNYSYTDTYTTNGSFSQSASISLSSNSGNFSASGTAASSFEGMLHQFVGTGEDTYTLDISSSTVAHVDPTNTTPSHLTLSCTYSNPTAVGGAADYEYHNLSCSDPNFTDIGRYNVTLNAVNDAVTITGTRADTYAIFRSTSDPSYDYETSSDMTMLTANSFSGSLSFSENGSLSGNGSISLNTTTTNINSLKIAMPKMIINNLVIPTYPSVYNGTDFNISLTDPFVICYGTDAYRDAFNFTVRRNDTSDIYNASEIYKMAGLTQTNRLQGGLCIIALETKINNNISEIYGHSITNIFTNYNFNYGCYPIYVGYKSNMSDSVYRFIYGSDRIIEAINNQTNIIENGNTNSQNKGQQLDTKTNQMQTQMTQFQNIEDTASDSMNSALQNINTNPSLMSTNKFLVSVDWIRQQYNRIVTNTPFEAVITFCLVFGLGLLLLGKVR